ELTLINLVKALNQRGHEITIAAPAGSVLRGATILEVEGALAATAHTQSREQPVVLATDGVLVKLCDRIRQVQDDYSLIVNFAYDWLPFFLTPFFRIPIAHFVSMGSLSDAMDSIIAQIAQRYPGSLGAYTQTQVETFPLQQDWEILGSAVDLSQYDYCETPEPWLAWMGRISPEKGLEDAVEAVQRTQIPLKILGKLEDPHYWNKIQSEYPNAPIEYLGFFSTQELQEVVRRASALLMTPRWHEAFGNVAIEALACGVPVIAYRRGGPTEIIKQGETGWLVEPDSVDGLVVAINQLAKLNRRQCRQQAEADYSLTALGERFEGWFDRIVHSHPRLGKLNS
ncbi:MAG: glycosyltransferase family 4 protein, partial [Cyanobacteria bacterium P01_A01_bin.114]